MKPWTHELARPLPMMAIAVLLLNDHFLKHALVLSGSVTGKLSDIAGLFFFPILLFAFTRAWFGEPVKRTRRAAWIGALTFAAFAAIKVHPTLNAAANRVLGVVALDPTDALALPAVLASIVYLRRAPRPMVSEGWGRISVLAAALASFATSPPRLERNYPAWQVVGPSGRQWGCAGLQAEVVKSGKQGVGVVLTRRGTCPVEIARADLRIGSQTVHSLPTTDWDAEQTLYLAFLFDNEALWNAKQRAGTLELKALVDEQATSVRFELQHAWSSPHRAKDLPSATSGTSDTGPADAGDAR